jgi:hypothetical protein
LSKRLGVVLVCKASIKDLKNPLVQQKKCLACSASPPFISNTIIRNLGASLCKVNKELLEDTNPGKKGMAAAPVGRTQDKNKKA